MLQSSPQNRTFGQRLFLWKNNGFSELVNISCEGAFKLHLFMMAVNIHLGGLKYILIKHVLVLISIVTFSVLLIHI